MYFSKEGRKDYLDFIKNIPIQSLLFFISAMFFHGGLTGKETTIKTIVAIFLLLMGLGAALASTSLFVESLRKNLVSPEKERARTKYPPIQGSVKDRFKQSCRRWWATKRALLEVFVVLLVIDIAFSVAMISALLSTFGALHINTST